MNNKKIVLSLLVSIGFVSVFVATAVFAQDINQEHFNPIKSGVIKIIKPNPSGISSSTQPVKPPIPGKKFINPKIRRQIKARIRKIRRMENCGISDDLLQELNDLTFKVGIAKAQGNNELVKELISKIKSIRNEIKQKREECRQQEGNQNEDKNKENQNENQNERNKAIIGRIHSRAIPFFCQKEQSIRKKLDYYKKLISLKSEELKAKGYSKEEVAKIIAELNREMSKAHLMCVNPKGISKMPLIAPVAPSDGKDIVSYYKKKVDEVMSENKNVDEQIGELKKLRNNINGMIKELIRSKKQVKYSEIKPLVKEMTIKPGEIQADQVSIETPEQKDIEVSVGKEGTDISVDKKRVRLGKKIKALILSPVKIDNGKIIIGGKEIKATPDEIAKKVKASPQADINIVNQGNKPIYKVKNLLRKRFLGIFPVKFTQESEIDATQPGGKIIKIKRPWWSFLAF